MGLKRKEEEGNTNAVSDRCYTRDSVKCGESLKKSHLCATDIWIIVSSLQPPPLWTALNNIKHLGITVWLCHLSPLKAINLCVSSLLISQFLPSLIYTFVFAFCPTLSLPVAPHTFDENWFACDLIVTTVSVCVCKCCMWAWQWRLYRRIFCVWVASF